MANRVIEFIVKAKDQSKGVLSKIGINLGGVGGKYAAMAGAALAAGVVVVAALVKMGKAAVAFVLEMAAVGDEFDKMSTRTSLSVEELGEWVFLMERAGGSAASFESAIRRLTKSMVDNQRGLSTAVDAWDAVGVSVLDANGELRAVSDVLLDLGDALERMDNQTERLGVSQDILGRGAAQMVALLAQGRGELNRQLGIFGRVNGQITKEFTDGAAAIVDAQTDLDTAIRGLKASLVEPFQSDIAVVIDEIAFAVADVGRAFDDHGEDIIRLIEIMNPLFNALASSVHLYQIAAEAAKEEATGLGLSLADMAAGFKEAAEAPVEGARAAKDAIAEERAAAEELNATLREMIELDAELRDLGPLKIFDTAPEDDPENLIDIMDRLRQMMREYDAEIQKALMGTEDLFDPSLTEEALDALQVYIEQIHALQDAVFNVASGMERVISNAVFDTMTGQVVNLSTAIRDVLLGALSDMIAKLIVIKALSLFNIPGFGGIASLGLPGGGSDKSGGVTKALDSGFMNSSALSPFELGAGSDKELHLHMDIGRPTGRLDMISLGEDLVAAADFVKESTI